MLGLNETIHQLAMAHKVHLYDRVLKREGGQVLRRALEFELEGQRKKGEAKRIRKKMSHADQSGSVVLIQLATLT